MQETSSCVLKPKGLDISQVLEEIPLRDLKIIANDAETTF